MALSGTLDTFALPDVLRLLATTQKSGRLRVSGTRGSGSVWVSEGEIVASELTTNGSLAPSAVDVVFGLLRFDAGSFTFESEATPAAAGPAMAMDPILTSAEQMLAEWRSIEAVVPSLDVWVGLLPELDAPDVMIDANRWRCIATVGAGCQVGLIAETSNLTEIDACRLVKELIELGLLTVLEAPSELGSDTSIVPDAEAVGRHDLDDSSQYENEFGAFGDAERAGVADARFDSLSEAAPRFGDTAPLTDFAPPTELDTQAAGGSIAVDTGADESSRFAGTAEVGADTADLNPAEMARQLANLSPKAAKAVAAAAKASTEAERDAALAAVEAEDSSVNRSLLLKFLGSVDS